MDPSALKVLSYFQYRGIGITPLGNKETEKNQSFLLDWSKPWKYSFLRKRVNANELKLIWEKKLYLQASSPQSYKNQERAIRRSLAKINPPVELQRVDPRDHYKNQRDIEQAVAMGKLQPLNLRNINLPNPEYVPPPLAEIFKNDIDPALALAPNIFIVSSAVRPLDEQQLLRKLAYPAAKSSYHTLRRGGAVDLKLTLEKRAKWVKQLQRTISGKTSYEKITDLYRQGTQPTIENLLKNGLLNKENDVVKAYWAIRESVRGRKIVVVDETPFFILFDENKNITKINPVFHVQYIGSD